MNVIGPASTHRKLITLLFCFSKVYTLVCKAYVMKFVLTIALLFVIYFVMLSSNLDLGVGGY